MKNFAEQQMGAVVDPSAYRNHSPMNNSTGYGGTEAPKPPALEDVRTALGLARALALRVRTVEVRLLGGGILDIDTKDASKLPEGVFPQLATTSRETCEEICRAEEALDRILDSV